MDDMVVLAKETRMMLEMHIKSCNGNAERTANDIHSIREALHQDRQERKAGINRIHDRLEAQQKAVFGTLVMALLMSIGAIATMVWGLLFP